jgi:hypothetical protein
MTTLEHDLDRLREQLRLATAADLRRRARRRRRILRAAVVPGVALAAGGVAFAVVPALNEPAPPQLQKSFDDLYSQVPDRPPFLPEGTKLSLWARDGDLAFYGASRPSGTWCGLFARAGVIQSVSCVSVGPRPGPDEIRFDSIGGATHRAANFASGQVGAPDAVTIEISARGVAETVKVPVGHDGWFVAQLPDATLGSLEPEAKPPMLTAVARDAGGAIVARSTMPPLTAPRSAEP